MVKVTDNHIEITAGDSGIFDVTIMNGESEYDYSNDEVKFGVKKNFNDATCVIEKDVVDGKVTLEPEDTKDLSVGIYFYDVKVVTSEGEVCTVISAQQFEVCHSVLKSFTAEEGV